MNKSILLIFSGLIALCSTVYGQSNRFSNPDMAKIAIVKQTSGWVEFYDRTVSDPEFIFQQNKSAFGLSDKDEMNLTQKNTDKIGFTHYRFQQYYQGIPVMGAEYWIHAENAFAKSGNGKILSGLNISTTPQITAEDAITKALAFTAARKYMWESEANESMLKYLKGDPDATYKPKAELVIIDRSFGDLSTNYRLAWKVNVYAEDPISNRDIFIDAQSGSIYHTLNKLITDDVDGIAVTRYSGTQNIVTDSTGPGMYRLRESGRGNGIETYDMNEGTVYGSAVDFTDTDNYWDNVNAQQDEVATDAHFGAEMTYDYYLYIHNRHSYDDLDSKLASYVHYDLNYDNAFWDGTRMTYGDGSGSYGPFTSLDVCGHEITHGVTQYTANLIYQNEQGALNEAFSDMFGTAVEFYALDTLGDWFIGEDFDLTGNGFRNMADPKSDQLPDTYHGQYWYAGSFDYGGVHTNCGVAAYWFYLLSEGGNDVNDLGNTYNVQGVSIDTAAQIAYRALSVYLVSSSNYMDCRVATLQSAADLYGQCSNAYIQCANAWYAVGVGMAVSDYDFSMAAITSPTTACGMTSDSVKVMLIYNGCNVPVLSGDSIYLSYSLDGQTAIEELLVLNQDYYGGDTLNYTFSTPVDVSMLGFHTIDAWYYYVNDTLFYNDTILNYTFENRLYQNVDVGLTAITSPESSCNLSNDENITVDIEFFGCDYLPSGETIVLAYSINGGTAVYDSLTLVADLYPGTPLSFTFGPGADLLTSGTYSINAWTEYAADTLTTNDQAPVLSVKKPFVMSDTIITFDETNTTNNFLVYTTNFSHAMVSTSAELTGARGFLMTGGNPMQYYDMIEFPSGSNTWLINDFLSARIDFCVDASAWTSAHLSWDMKQTFGEQAYNTYLGPGDYTIASNFRVLVNNTDQIGGTYNPTTASSDPYSKRFADLSAYAGNFFTLSFETRNLSKDTIIFTMDNAYIDNVRLSEQSQVGTEENDLSNHLNVYPNPGNGKFFVNIFCEQNGIMQFDIFDALGKLVKTQSAHVYVGENNIPIELQEFPTGIYLIRSLTDQTVLSAKVIKN